MANSILTPLQLTVAASLLQNQGIKHLPVTLTTAIDAYNATTVIADWIAAVNFYKTRSYFTETTFDALLSIGSTVCPALGNSIPAAPVGTYTNLINEYLTPNTVTDGSTIDPSGFSWLIKQTGAAYLGDGDAGRLAQGFLAVQGYISTTNAYINSAVNANTYLGPTFTSTDDLITNNIASINTNLPAFGLDLAKQGQLTDLGNLDLYGTPAGLLQQLSKITGIRSLSLPAVQAAMIAAGLSTQNISDLVNNNRQTLLNPTGLTQNQFDTLQKLAYNAMTQVTGTDLLEILDILDVTTPNIDTMAELLDPIAIFPNSYKTMQTMGTTGYIPIVDANGVPSSNVAAAVSSFLPTATGCDELGKVIPPSSAVINKAIQVALQQIGGIANISLPQLAEIVAGFTTSQWDVADEYLVNAVVANGGPVPTNYIAVQDIPAGTDINNTDYWQPTTLGGLNTTEGLPLIQNQTTAVDSSVTDYFADNVATGTGPNGSITTYDVIGLAIDSNDFASRLATATTTINTLDGLGTLAALKTTYTNMLGAANDAAMLAYIATANADIVTIAAAQPASVATLNTAWTYMANLLNKEKGYQNQAGLDYFNLQAADKNSVYSLVQNLPQYAQITTAQDACEFLQNIADTATLGGQAIVGSMREARNTVRLSSAGLLTTANQIPADPPVDPIPAIVPVN